MVSRSLLLTDHLGSTAVTADGSGTKYGELRYKGWGETRFSEGTTPTMYRFTGQHLNESIGLYFYKARYYDPAPGRFIQPDTIVPQPANPQSLNRYSYVLNNPLRYTDPTGMFSEDEIMGYLGVGTWEEVLAFFVAGGELEGRWGWLETLRAAELGDVVQFFSDYEGLWPAWLGATVMAEGQFVEQGGQLYIQFGGTLTAASQAAWWGNAFGVRRPSSGSGLQYFGPFYAETMYWHRRFDPGRVDWEGAALDAAGIVADVFTLGVAGTGTNAAKIAKTAREYGLVLDLTSLTRSGLTAAGAAVQGRPSVTEGFDVALDVGGFMVPIVPDLVSLMMNFHQATYLTL